MKARKILICIFLLREKKILLEQQSDQDLDAIVSTSSSQVNQRAGPSTINSISAELTRRGNSSMFLISHTISLLSRSYKQPQ